MIVFGYYGKAIDAKSTTTLGNKASPRRLLRHASAEQSQRSHRCSRPAPESAKPSRLGEVQRPTALLLCERLNINLLEEVMVRGVVDIQFLLCHFDSSPVPATILEPLWPPQQMRARFRPGSSAISHARDSKYAGDRRRPR